MGRAHYIWMLRGIFLETIDWFVRSCAIGWIDVPEGVWCVSRSLWTSGWGGGEVSPCIPIYNNYVTHQFLKERGMLPDLKCAICFLRLFRFCVWHQFAGVPPQRFSWIHHVTSLWYIKRMDCVLNFWLSKSCCIMSLNLKKLRFLKFWNSLA